MVLSLLPLLLTPLPPLRDLPGHMGRYYVSLELQHSDTLKQNWDFSWSLITNLGFDLLILPLAGIIGLQSATWLLTALLAPLMISGFFRVAKAVHGHAPPTWLAALPFAMSFPYHYGFVNYWFSCALALHAFASWIRAKERAPFSAVPIVLLSLSCLVLWLVHVYGWLLLVMLAGGYEASRVWSWRIRDLPRVAGVVIFRSLPLFSPVILLGQHGYAAQQGYEFSLYWKVWGLVQALRDQSLPLDVFTMVFATCVIAAPLFSRQWSYNSRLFITAAVLSVIWLPMPEAFLGGYHASVRLVPVISALLILSVSTNGIDAYVRKLIAVASLGLFALRIGADIIGFAAYAKDFDRQLLALDHIERGKRIVVLNGMPCWDDWRSPRLDHIDSMAIVHRDAFVNSQWAVPGAHLIVPKGGSGTQYNVDPSQFQWAYGNCGKAMPHTIQSALVDLPTGRFDYAWLIGFDDVTLRTAATTAGFETLYQTDGGLLLRLTDSGSP